MHFHAVSRFWWAQRDEEKLGRINEHTQHSDSWCPLESKSHVGRHVPSFNQACVASELSNHVPERNGSKRDKFNAQTDLKQVWALQSVDLRTEGTASGSPAGTTKLSWTLGIWTQIDCSSWKAKSVQQDFRWLQLPLIASGVQPVPNTWWQYKLARKLHFHKRTAKCLPMNLQFKFVKF